MARILIAGCGYVGMALGERLATESDTVWGLRRRPVGFPPGVRALEADLAVAATLADLPPGLDAVVYAASPGGADDALYRTAYVEGLGNLLEALSKQGQRPRRVILVSSTAVYAQQQGEWVDESSPTEPEHYSGLRLLESEALLRDGPFASTVLRLGGIYGPRRTRLVESVRSGRATYTEGRPRYTNRIHRDDCVGALVHLIRHEAPESLYLGVDDEPTEEVTVLRWLAGVLGAPEPRPVKAADPKGRLARGNKRCRNAKLVASGYRFRYPTFREGYTAVLEGL